MSSCSIVSGSCSLGLGNVAIGYSQLVQVSCVQAAVVTSVTKAAIRCCTRALKQISACLTLVLTLCRQVGVPLSRIFTINPKGQIQKASSAVQSSTWSSLSAINDLVDEMFPPLLPTTSAAAAAAGMSTPPAALSAAGILPADEERQGAVAVVGAAGAGAAGGRVSEDGGAALLPQVVVQPQRDEFNDVQVGVTVWMLLLTY